MTAILFDTETTGTGDDDQIIESAVARVSLFIDAPLARAGVIDVQRFKPTRPISHGAMATHGILASDLVDRPGPETFALPEGTEYIVGHNVDFDWRMAGKPKVKRICTLALSRGLWPTLDSHTQSALLYFLLPAETARERLVGAHSAYRDVDNLAIVLNAICDSLRPDSWEQLWTMSEDARVPRYITFGKHKAPAGQPPRQFDSLPGDYLQWMLRQTDMDPYVLEAARRALKGGR